MDDDGDFAAAWIETKYQQTDHGFQAPSALFVQQYSAAGVASGARTQVSSFTDYLAQYVDGLSSFGSSTAAPQVVMDGNGDIDVAWSNFSYAGSCNFYGFCSPVNGVDNIYAAAYRADGTVTSPKTTVDQTAYSANQLPQSLMGLYKLGKGAVSMTVSSFGDPEVSQQLLSPELAKEGAQLALAPPMPSYGIATASDANGNTAVLWSSQTACEVQRYDAQGVVIGTPVLVPIGKAAGCYKASLAMNASGAFAVTWGVGLHTPEGSPYTGLYGQLFNAAGSTNGASFAIRQGSSGIDNLVTAVNVDGGLVVVWSEHLKQQYSVLARLVSP